MEIQQKKKKHVFEVSNPKEAKTVNYKNKKDNERDMNILEPRKYTM